jgi:tripeptidyl-peptidase-2
MIDLPFQFEMKKSSSHLYTSSKMKHRAPRRGYHLSVRVLVSFLVVVATTITTVLVESFSLPAGGENTPQPNRNYPTPIETKNNGTQKEDSIIVKEDKNTNSNNNNNNTINNSNINIQSRQQQQTTRLMTSSQSTPFPTHALLPKAETNADTFVANHPKYDGRGTIVGILDTGVDPGAIGLSQLPYNQEGETGDNGRKLIHVADCTGSGDVAMDVETVAVKRDHGWVIEKNVYGEESKDCIILNPDLDLKPFPNSDETAEEVQTEKGDGDKKEDEEEKGNEIKMPVRLGFKRLYELFPKKLTTRMKKHYKTQFETKQHQHAVQIHEKLAQFKTKFESKQPTPEELREKQDLDALLEVLNGKGLNDNDPLSNDPGPLCQVISFYDGKDYRVIIDLHCDYDNDDNGKKSGDLSTLPISKAMTDYYKEGQYGTFSHVDMCNYAVNFYQEGKIVSIVVDAGAHGSHVAGITSRYHPSQTDDEDDEPNGVAPGAKLISLKIGDTRLGSMETGSALTRALIEAVKHKCDVINLSYGEGCALPNSGRFVRLAEELVHKHGIVFVSSAGNNGPALTTVGAPGGTSG